MLRGTQHGQLSQDCYSTENSNTMEALASRVAQNNFGGIADIVNNGEPVTVAQHGRPRS